MTNATQQAAAPSNSITKEINQAISAAIASEKTGNSAMGKLGLSLYQLAKSNKRVNDLVSEYAKGTVKERMETVMNTLCKEYVDGFTALVDSKLESKNAKAEAATRLRSIRKCMERGLKIAGILLHGKTAEGVAFGNAKITKAGLIRVDDANGEEVDDFSASALVSKAQRDLRPASKAASRQTKVANAGTSVLGAAKFLTHEINGIVADNKPLTKPMRDELQDLYIHLVALFKEEGTSKLYKASIAA